MTAKQNYDSDLILHVRLPAGLKAKLQRKAGNSKTLGALVTELLLDGLKSPKEWSLETKIKSLKFTLGAYRNQLHYLHLLIDSHTKRMRGEGKEADERLNRAASYFKKLERVTKKATAAAKRRRRGQEAANQKEKRSLDKIFSSMGLPPERPQHAHDDLTVYDWRWLSLTVALDKMKRGEMGKFATAVGISPSMLSRYRSSRTSKGHRRITKDVACRMAKVLGIDAVAFDKWDQEKAPSLRLGLSIDSLIATLNGVQGQSNRAIKKRASAQLRVDNPISAPNPKKRTSARRLTNKQTSDNGSGRKRAPSRLSSDDQFRM